MNTVYTAPQKKEIEANKVLREGDLVARVVLGECRVSRVTQVEGLPNYPFYRTDSGTCYSYEEGLTSPIEAQRIAMQKRKGYETVIPANLEDRFTVEYEPRECDGRVLWAQIGIFNGMLYWKENCTYQFLEAFATTRELKKAYEIHKKNIMSFSGYKEVNEEHEMRRLYKSTTFSGYADAEYVQTNH